MAKNTGDKLHYNTSPEDVERLCKLVKEGLNVRKDILNNTSFNSSKLSKTVSMAKSFGFIEDGNVGYNLTSRGKSLFKRNNQKTKAYREGVSQHGTYSKILGQLEQHLAGEEPEITKSELGRLMNSCLDHGLGKTSFSYAVRDTMKVLDAAGYGEYVKKSGGKSRFILDTQRFSKSNENNGFDKEIGQRGSLIKESHQEGKIILEIPDSISYAKYKRLKSKLEEALQEQ